MQDASNNTALESDTGQTPDNKRLWLAGLPCLLLIAMTLYFFPLSVLNLPGLALMVTGLSWCLYQYFLPLHLIRRHAMLEHVTSHDSVLRRWLWNGLWSKLLLFFWSLVLALTVLVLLNGFADAQWWLLFASVPLMLLLVPPGLRLAGAETGVRYHFPLALRVAVYLTITITVLGLMGLQLFGEGVDDTRHLTLLQLVSQSWSGAQNGSAVREIGWLLGAEAVINDLVWYLMQQAASLSEQSAGFKLAAWLLFLLFITLQAAVFWFVLAGALSWLMASCYIKGPLLAGANPGRTFVIGVCMFSAISYLMMQPGVTGFMSVLADRSMQALPMPAADPCVRQLPQEMTQVQTRSTQRMAASGADLQNRLSVQLDTTLDAAFALAEPAVDQYLDWNFSLTGQYAQLLFMAQAVAETGMDRSNTGTLQHGIEQRFSGYTSSKIDEYVGAALNPELQQARVLMQQQFAESAQQFYLQQATYIEDQLGASDCLKLALPAMSTPDLVHKSAVGAGPVAGLVVAGIAARGSARVGANVLARNATKRAVSAGAAKVASKTVQSSGMSSIGLGCGPLAPVCVPALFVATWLGTDLLINEIDESLNRTALRGEMLAALQAEKLRLKSEYQAVLEVGAAQLLADISHYRDQRFKILDQGI